MSAFKPSNNLLTDTILFEAIAKIRQESDYRREVESYVLEQNGLASVRQLSEDKKRLFTRIVDAIIAEGVDEIDPSMYVMNEAYGKAIREATPDERRSAAYVRNAARMAAKTRHDTGGEKEGENISPELKRNQRILDRMKDQNKIHDTFMKAGKAREQVRDIQRATTKPRTQQDEDHSPVDPESYNEKAQSAANLHNALGRHLAKNVKEKDVEEGLSRFMGQRHDVSTAGKFMGAIGKGTREVGRDVAAATLRAAKNLGTAGLRVATPYVKKLGLREDDLQELSPELLRRAATAQGRKRYQKDKRGNLPSYKAGDAMTARMDKFEQGAKDAERRDELHDMTPRMRELYRKQGGRIPAGTDMRKPAPKPEKK